MPPPGIAPNPMAAPPPIPPPMSGAGLGPETLVGAGLLSDLPAHLGVGWQALDVAVRAYKIATRSKDMQKFPKVVALVQSQMSALQRVIALYTAGSAGGSELPSSSPSSPSNDATSGGAQASDADSQPGLSADE